MVAIEPQQPAFPDAGGTGRLFVLHPGDIACGERGDTFETLLGSCVAVVLTDRKRTLAAMCHIVYSKPALHAEGKATASMDAAFDAMYRQLAARGMNPRLCQAFVYGGGNMFPDLYRAPHVGADNCEAVLERLRADGLAVCFQDLGRNVYRRLRWTIGPELPSCIALDSEGEQG